MHLKNFSDQLGREIEIVFPPQRIISLVPSQTELLFDLGLDKEVVGVTKFCVRPLHGRKEKAIVGGTKNFHFNIIEKLKPDLIVGNKEENDKEGIELLAKKFPVWLSDVGNFSAALEMIHSIGEITNKQVMAASILSQIQANFGSLAPTKEKRVLYLIWKNPWMVAGNDTFIHSMLEKMGLKNCVSEPRYPTISAELIKKLEPEIIFLPSEPFPFQQNDVKEIQALHPTAHVSLVDGEYFSWFGSRMAHAPRYFHSILNAF